MSKRMIEVNGLTKKFTASQGIFDVSLNVQRGEAVGFIGPNGSGKSTTIRHLLGFIKPDSGHSFINGHETWSEPQVAKKGLGYLAGELGFPQGLSARAFLDLLVHLHGANRSTRRAELIDRFDLKLETPIARMSKGTKQKLAIVATFLLNPEIVILDEPSSGLDPLMQDELIRLLIEEKAAGRTILLSSHIFEEVEAVADRVTVIRSGRIVGDERLQDAMSSLGNSLIVKFACFIEAKEFTSILAEQVSPNELKFDLSKGVSLILETLQGRDVVDLKTERQTLRDYFRDAYRGEREE